MGERKSKQVLEKIKKKYNVDQLWSFSKYNSYKTDPFGWMLKYLKHEKETKTSIWGVSGNGIHDIIEKLYTNEITYDEMLPQYENKLFEMNVAELKYNRKDEEANRKLGDKYEANMRLFFQQHNVIPFKVITEQFVTIKVGQYIFQGYIDCVHKDDKGNFIITDWKSSTMYVGKKIQKESAQLILYAESLIQKGIPIDKIIIRWSFLKYCLIEYQLKGIDKETGMHKTKTTKGLRTEYVCKLENNLKMWLKESGYDELEIEDMVQTAIENNNLDNIPKDISEKYNVSDCYVEIPLTQEVVDDLKSNVKNTLDEINVKTHQYNQLMLMVKETNDKKIQNEYIDLAEELFWTEIDGTNQFFFSNLCGYSAKVHKPYKEYLDSLDFFVKEEYKSSTENEEDDDWLKDL